MYAVALSKGKRAGTVFVLLIMTMAFPTIVIAIALFYLFGISSQHISIVIGHSIIAAPIAFAVLLRSLRCNVSGGGLKMTLPLQMWNAILLQVTPTLTAASVVVLAVAIVIQPSGSGAAALYLGPSNGKDCVRKRIVNIRSLRFIIYPHPQAAPGRKPFGKPNMRSSQAATRSRSRPLAAHIRPAG